MSRKTHRKQAVPRNPVSPTWSLDDVDRLHPKLDKGGRTVEDDDPVWHTEALY